jgi:protein ImuB
MFAAIYTPDFALQAVLRHEPELHQHPVAIIAADATKPFVLQTTRAAFEQGVTAGLTPPQALARCATLIIKPRSLPMEAAATELLLQTAYCFSPHIESTAAGVCTMDLQKLNVDGGFNDWARRIRSALASVQLRTQIGVATTPNIALLAARATTDVLVVEETTNFMSALPIEALDPDPALLDVLSRWGVHTIGEFVALGKDRVTERLGAPALELFERASVNSIRPLNVVVPPDTFQEQIEFENEVETVEPLLFVLQRFTEQLAARIALSYRVIGALHLRLGLSSGATYECTFKIPAPTGKATTLFRTLHTHLENLRTDAPIASVQLVATPVRSETQQFSLFESALRDPNQFHETLARLTALLGADRVGTPIVEPTYRPDAFRIQTPDFNTHRKFDTQRSSLQTALALRRFRPPTRAAVSVRDGQPVLLNTREFVGAIARARGPFRSSGDWWESGRAWNREEWDVETADGKLLRLFRQNDEWFVEGVYD